MSGYLFFGYWRKDCCSLKYMSLVAVAKDDDKNITKIIDEFDNFGEIRGGKQGNAGDFNYRIHGLLTKEKYIPFTEIEKIANKYNIKPVNATKYTQKIPTLHTSDYEDAFVEIVLQHMSDIDDNNKKKIKDFLRSLYYKILKSLHQQHK